MFLKPAHPDVRVPDPAQQGTPDYWLPADGRRVEPSLYWTRRVIDGDVVEALEPPAATEPAPEPADAAPPPAA